MVVGASGAVWDSTADLRAARLFDFSLGLKVRPLPPPVQFLKI